jgi:SAM-dependent methyltransferase
VTDGPRSYERYLVPEFFVPCAEQLVRLAAPAAGERAVDLACGTGVVARRLADRGLSVTGVDVTDAMVAFAAAAEPRVDWRVAAAGALPLGDGTVDLVCCQQGLQFFPDPAGAMRDVHRRAGPGAGRPARRAARTRPGPVHGRRRGRAADADLARHRLPLRPRTSNCVRTGSILGGCAGRNHR